MQYSKAYHKWTHYLLHEYPRSPVVSWLFLRLLALIYFAAFTSASVQVLGLIGGEGILPVSDMLNSLTALGSKQVYWRVPTLFWLNASDYVLVSVCYAGMIVASMLFLNILTRLSLVLCFILYLSIVNAGQTFFLFQWDSLLLESGFLAIGLSFGSRFFVFLYRLLIARFMFMGGVVKIASGDPAWSDLTALNFHYLTQPLPTPLAYYAYQLPEWFNKFCVAGVFFIELIVPFLVFFPGCFRKFAGVSFVILQTAIILTGNYNFFNLLAILLCLMLFTDRDVKPFLPHKWFDMVTAHQPVVTRWTKRISAVYTGFVVIICLSYVWVYHTGHIPFIPLKRMLQVASSFSLVSNYGPFAVMTRTRPEIIIQGSLDGKKWRDYRFNYKPVDTHQPLQWNIPHQPRLDWQLWFAALSNARQNPWFINFINRLREGSPQVMELLAENPFPGQAPPFVRAHLYQYEFTSQELRDETGEVWQRRYLGRYF